MQTQKTNFVYNNDQVYLCNQKKHIHQNPCLYLHSGNRRMSMKSNIGTDEADFEDIQVEVKADLEKRTPLKINLHMDVEVVEDENSLKTGDVIWLTFSERPYYMQGILSPFAIESTISNVADQLAASYLEVGNENVGVEDQAQNNASLKSLGNTKQPTNNSSTMVDYSY
jgi:hypothetical protein